MTPSKKQNRIYKEFTDTNNSINIVARAGVGKTTTLLGCLELIPKHLDVAFFAFNKSIVEELKSRLPNRQKNISITTAHSFGSQVLYNHLGKIALNENKSYRMCISTYKRWEEGREVKENKFTYCDRIAQIVNLMKLTLTDPNSADVEALAEKYDIMAIGNEIEHAIEIFDRSLSDLKSIDFNDMVFIPAIKNFKMKKFDVVFVDEAQDINLAIISIIKKIIKPNGRLISVGDDMQSIYGFAGADYDSFSKLRELMPGTVSLPLSVSYRCAKSVIRFAQNIVPDIEYSEDAIEGEVREGSIEEIVDGDMVLCRNVKPLVFLLFHLVSKGIKANIRGREIGKNIISTIEKTKQSTTKSLIEAMKVERANLKIKLMKKGVYRPDNHVQLRQASEKIEIVKILAKQTSSVKGVIDLLNTIFIEDGFKGVILSTIHKAKGHESTNVFILKPELMPSEYATTKEQLDQEKNLRYVAFTRAKEKLIFITDFYLDENQNDINDM